MGRDPSYTEQMAALMIFQSTRPAWGATSKAAQTVGKYTISIHAPRMGRDSYA